MAHLQCFLDLQYIKKGEPSRNVWMGCTMYTKGNLLLVLCVDGPDLGAHNSGKPCFGA